MTYQMVRGGQQKHLVQLLLGQLEQRHPIRRSFCFWLLRMGRLRLQRPKRRPTNFKKIEISSRKDKMHIYRYINIMKIKKNFNLKTKNKSATRKKLTKNFILKSWVLFFAKCKFVKCSLNWSWLIVDPILAVPFIVPYFHCFPLGSSGK